jgi:hypothetical protein
MTKVNCELRGNQKENVEIFKLYIKVLPGDFRKTR